MIVEKRLLVLQIQLVVYHVSPEQNRLPKTFLENLFLLMGEKKRNVIKVGLYFMLPKNVFEERNLAGINSDLKNLSIVVLPELDQVALRAPTEVPFAMRSWPFVEIVII